MGFIEDLSKWLIGGIQFALRRFVVYSLILFFIGMFVGLRLIQKGAEQDAIMMALFAPLLLAGLAFLYTEIAAIIFLLLIIPVLLILL